MLVEHFNPIATDMTLRESVAPYTIQTLQVCYEALDEGANDQTILSTIKSYTYSLILDLLENIRAMLLKLYESALLAFNNYVLNTAKVAERYEKILIDRFQKLKEPFMYEKYTYPQLYTLPIDIRHLYDITKDCDEIADLAQGDPNIARTKIETKVDLAIKAFGKNVMESPVDPLRVKDSIRKISADKMQGKLERKRLTQSDIQTFIGEIKTFADTRDSIKDTKSAITSYYQKMKGSYMAIFKNREIPAKIDDLRAAKNPEMADILTRQYQQYGFMQIEINRLFSGYCMIYQEAFTAKLNYLQEKIEADRKVLVDLMTKTSILTAVRVVPETKRQITDNDTPLKF